MEPAAAAPAAAAAAERPLERARSSRTLAHAQLVERSALAALHSDLPALMAALPPAERLQLLPWTLGQLERAAAAAGGAAAAEQPLVLALLDAARNAMLPPEGWRRRRRRRPPPPAARARYSATTR